MNKVQEKIKQALERGEFFKFICAVGNEDMELVKRLSMVYTLAGVHVIDVAADPDMIKGVIEGREKAYQIAPQSVDPDLPALMVSVGLKDDPHTRKVYVKKETCSQCGQCLEVCLHQCLKLIGGKLHIDEKRCIGCGRCAEVCPEDVLDYIHRETDIAGVLASVLPLGVDMVELHASTSDTEEIEKKWRIIAETVPQEMFVSCSIGSGYVSPRELTQQVEMIYNITRKRTIIQADGLPMGGGAEGKHISLQAVATADIILRKGLPVYVQASGGTNDQTKSLAHLAGVKLHGVGVGSYARKLIWPEVNRADFYQKDILKTAITKARHLVNSVK